VRPKILLRYSEILIKGHREANLPK